MSLERGDLKATQEYFEKSLTLREQLAQQDPNSAQAPGATSRSLIVVWAT